MKTFETEKHNIPEGATHYRDEDKSNLFTWFKVGNGIEFWYEAGRKWRGIGSHINCIMDKLVEIPQTDIETPEEKEALDSIALRQLSKSREREFLDLIDTTPHQYEMSKFSGKPSAKPEYVRCDISNVGFSDIVDLFFMENSGDFTHIGDIDAAKLIADKWKLYRRIETQESPQQREERERLEAAYDLFCVWSDGATPCSFDVFVNGTIGNSKRRFLAIVDKTNYRKESK